jgi:murein DD-endopeptidase MepM/ murein hydrolase activator NlpD
MSERDVGRAHERREQAEARETTRREARENEAREAASREAVALRRSMELAQLRRTLENDFLREQERQGRAEREEFDRFMHQIFAESAGKVLSEKEDQERRLADAAAAAENARAKAPRPQPPRHTVTEGYRVVPPFNPSRNRAHKGVDMNFANGTSIHVRQAGVVTFRGTKTGFGYVVDIYHGHGVTTRYAHLSEFGVANGQSVAAGDVIGKSGGVEGSDGAGNSSGAHLHFEVLVHDSQIDPESRSELIPE